MSYLRDLSGWCSRRVAEMERLINSCMNPSEQAERYKLSKLLQYSRRFRANVSSLDDMVRRLAKQQQDFLLGYKFDADKIMLMATARTQAVSLLSSCEQSSTKIHELAGRCNRKIEEELSRTRERIQTRRSSQSPQPRNTSTQRDSGRRLERRATVLRPQSSQEFELRSRPHYNE